MIASLSGILLHKDPTTIVLDVQGVGYEIQLSGRTYDTLPPTGEKASLHIHTNVREDAITLYGFADLEQKKLFLLLTTVSGVGPKLALSILSGIDPVELCNAISLKDMPRLTALLFGQRAAKCCHAFAHGFHRVGLKVERAGNVPVLPSVPQ